MTGARTSVRAYRNLPAATVSVKYRSEGGSNQSRPNEAKDPQEPRTGIPTRATSAYDAPVSTLPPASPPPRPEPDVPDATLLIHAASAGDKEAAGRLLPLVYDQLRKAAQQRLAGEAAGQTLSATALVHEAYLKLIGPRKLPWAGRAHFYAAAAEAMRQILIDRARSRRRRGEKPVPLNEIGEVAALAEADPEKILAVEAAVARLEADDPDAAAIVRLRFFAGLSIDDTAKALGTSPRTAARLWAYARAALYRDLSGR